MKKLIKNLLFPDPAKQKIISGPAKGMNVKYNVNHRFQHLLGLYEREIYPYINRGINKANTLIDVGANDGYYVMAFLKSGKNVIACEPGNIAEEIVSNGALNNFQQSEKFVIERRLIGSETNDRLSMMSLTENVHWPVFILVDIDGGEFDLLSSCNNDFDFGNCAWLIETHSLQLEQECIKFLSERNYKVTIIDNAWWRFLIPEQRPLAHNRWLYAEM